MHSSFMAALALDAVRERQRNAERLARLLPAPLPPTHGAARRRLARVAAAIARRLDDSVVLAGAPKTSHGA